MSDVLSLPDAEWLAEQTLAVIPEPLSRSPRRGSETERWALDRERVASDLAGLRYCWQHCWTIGGHREPCPHACRFSDSLRRTAALYGRHLSTAAIDRELRQLQERAGAPRPAALGCSIVSHDRLGYCSGCTPTLRDGGPNGTALEVLGWRLLALRDAAADTGPVPS